MRKIFTLILCLCTFLQAQDPFSDSGPVELRCFKTTFQDAAVIDKTTVKPGDTVHVIFNVQLKENWYNYWEFGGGISSPTRFSWKTPKGLTLTKMETPYPKYIFDSSIPTGYYKMKENPMYVATFKVADDAKGTLNFNSTINWQACEKNGNCVQPLDGPPIVSLSLKVGSESIANPEGVKLLEKAKKYLPTPAPEGWKIHAQVIELDLTDDDGEKSKKKAYKVTISAPHKLDKLHTNFFPTMEYLHYEERYYGYEAVNENTISKIFEYDNAMNDESLKPLPNVVGVITFKKDDHTVAYTLKGEISDKPYSASATGAAAGNAASEELPWRELGGGDGQKATGGFWESLMLAFLGGFILNLMPCVFPVLSIKVMGFVKQAKEGKGSAMLHSAVFSAGVIISFWILAGIMLALKASTGQDIDWGFQLQKPEVVLSLILILFAMSLNLFGVFEIGVGMSSVGSGTQKKGLTGSFMSGVLATVIATPCMAPMLGAALTYAFGQPNFIAMLIFTAIGLGMSFPYIMLAFFPKLLAFIPKPGAWMETFKQSMGFLMMLAVIWLLDTLQPQLTQPDNLVTIMWAFIGFSVALWVYGKYTPMFLEKSTRIKGLIAAILIGGLSLWYAYGKIDEKSPLNWEKFDEAKLDDYLSKGQPVFIDFTAKWCASCQVNKKVAMYPNAALFAQKGVITMKGDSTKPNSLVTKWLKKYHSKGVPLNLLFDGKNQRPVKFPEVYLKKTLETQLNKLEDSKK